MLGFRKSKVRVKRRLTPAGQDGVSVLIREGTYVTVRWLNFRLYSYFRPAKS